VLAITPQGVALVREPNKPAPVWWKLPGGASDPENPCESAEECVLRELEEETGLRAKKEDLEVISRQEKRTHVKVFFLANVASLDGLKQFGDEGEEVKIFPIQIIKEMIRNGEVFPPHLGAIAKILKK